MKAIDALLSINYKDVAARAGWTFIQVFLAAFIVAGESIINLLFAASWNDLLTLLLATALSATAAGLSAVKTIVLETIREIRKTSLK